MAPFPSDLPKIDPVSPYFEACTILEVNLQTPSVEVSKLLGKMNYKLARYMESRYKTLKAYMSGDHFESRKSAVEVCVFALILLYGTVKFDYSGT